MIFLWDFFRLLLQLGRGGVSLPVELMAAGAQASKVPVGILNCRFDLLPAPRHGHAVPAAEITKALQLADRDEQLALSQRAASSLRTDAAVLGAADRLAAEVIPTLTDGLDGHHTDALALALVAGQGDAGFTDELDRILAGIDEAVAAADGAPGAAVEQQMKEDRNAAITSSADRMQAFLQASDGWFGRADNASMVAVSRSIYWFTP